MSTVEALPPPLARVQFPALLVGVVGLAIALGGAILWPRSGLPAYLVGYLFWVGIALGGLGLTMLHRLVGGSWGLPVRRLLEASALTLPLMALLFIPLTLDMAALYPKWAIPASQIKDQVVLHKLRYLNVTGYCLRAGVFFAIWIALAYFNGRWSVQQDRTTEPAPSRRAQMFGGPGLVLLFVTATFAMIDWVMSLEPDWYSTIYSAMLIIGQGLSTFAFVILVASLLARAGVEPTASEATPGRFNDLGNLMLAFVMLWAYLSFSQFLIIWCGNLAEEIPWYLRRTRGGWQVVVVALMLFHFFVPFFFLLFRDVKRGANRLLMGVAAGILVMHLVDLTWLVLPAQAEPLARSGEGGPAIPWASLPLVLAATVGIGGLWLAAFTRNLRGKSLVPRNDPGIDVHAEAEHGEWELGGH